MACVSRAALARVAQRAGAAGERLLHSASRRQYEASSVFGARQSFRKGSHKAAAAALAMASFTGLGAVAVAEEESGGGAWGRRGSSHGKYHSPKREDGDNAAMHGEEEKFFDPDYEYLMVGDLRTWSSSWYPLPLLCLIVGQMAWIMLMFLRLCERIIRLCS